MLSMLLALSAFAAEPTSFELAQFHARRGEWTQARVAVNAALTADAQDYEAHHLNAVIHRQLGETGLLVATTAAWRAEQDGVAANVAHAAALAVDENGDCDQVAQLLEGLPEEPALAYVGKRIEWEAARHCDVDRQSVRAALKTQTSDLASARTYSLSLRVEDPIDKAMLTEVGALTAAGTGVSSLARRLWDKDRKVTGKLKAARKLLLAQADALSSSESMVELHHAAEIYRRAQHPDAEATLARLEKLAGVPVRQPSTAVLISVYEA
ncbi:MAG: hypothetical protein KC912_25105, partial [Proteobacteria bacterium]|nr:hypothetical protein [Pseudomonadota bacterium]